MRMIRGKQTEFQIISAASIVLCRKMFGKQIDLLFFLSGIFIEQFFFVFVYFY